MTHMPKQAANKRQGKKRTRVDERLNEGLHGAQVCGRDPEQLGGDVRAKQVQDVRLQHNSVRYPSRRQPRDAQQH